MKNRKEIFDSTLYHVLFGTWYVLSLLPFWLLYILSTVLSSVLFYVIRYRRKMVHQNIKDSYPQLSSKKRWLIERHFYEHFCDTFIESLKYISMSDKELKKRMSFKNIEIVRDSCRHGRSCALYLGHYANWEWVSSLPLWIDSNLGLCTQLYHPLENKVFDRLISYTRQRLGGKNIPVNESVRHFVNYKRDGHPILIGFIADQAPFWNNIHYWTNFLNHPETPIFTGPERLMKKFDMDVYYLDVRKVKRGHYTAEFKLMTSKPNKTSQFQLTEEYTRLLEQTINSAPSYWLWSHNRWKRTKEQWLHVIDQKTGKMHFD